MNLLTNAKWNTFSQAIKILAQLINIFYLAKLILPSEYGVMAIALVVVNFGMLFRDLGTNVSLIQRKAIDDSIIHTVFSLNIILGLIVCLLIVVVSPLMASYFALPKLFSVLFLLSLTFPISAFSSTHIALFSRESKFGLIAKIEITAALISLVIALVLAYLGYGVYSLVSQALSLSLITTILFCYFSSWKPKRFFSIDAAVFREILSFSGNLSLFNFVNYFSRNADTFLIGKFMNATTLGIYNMAYRIMLFPLQSLTFVVNRSLLPIISRYQDDVILIRTIYLNCVFVILLLVMPLMIGLALLSGPLIYFCLGTKWLMAADLLVWLAPTAIIQSLLSSTGTIFTAMGDTKILFRLGILGAALQVGAFLIGVNYDIVTFVKLYFYSNVLNLFPVMFFVLRIIDCSFWFFLKKIYIVVICTAIMYLSIDSFRLFYHGYNGSNSDLINFILQILIGIVSYAASIILLSSDVRRFVYKILQKSSS
ncbi:lipopolysaccharide biosynthesis protein [Klebsiella oxytoca]|uniref:lipopolysaccharide biosynthesis protein n=1 Tax=Klebsiella oxytoca TaxID=571 RepID=UPI0012ABEFB7|nr:lipopolysaccharide biosynthesis protein [Klebsiella oxytoca]HBM3242749.1 lipopolysaccharide biosynthesis protein [Klebsiella oxytoca]HEC2065312.1 lipopolysaccharide biosynthesis protein [Klebsiella oxytoca]HEJ7641107.1 lipopolysaccharide biosynthesis protein [Klebsiella oxytoca]